jgi:hypothetical protein
MILTIQDTENGVSVGGDETDFNGDTLNNMENKRMRLIVTPEEAINYGIKNNINGLPDFMIGKTVEEALETYKLSLLNETEKKMHDYKLSFNDDAKMEELIFYIATKLSDSSGMEGVNASKTGPLGATGHMQPRKTTVEMVVDLSLCLIPPEHGAKAANDFKIAVDALRTACRSELLNNAADSAGLLKTVTLEQIKNNALTNQEFLKVKKEYHKGGISSSVSNNEKRTDQYLFDSSQNPTTDRCIKEPRQLGVFAIVDMSDEGRYRTTDVSAVHVRRGTNICCSITSFIRHIYNCKYTKLTWFFYTSISCRILR